MKEASGDEASGDGSGLLCVSPLSKMAPSPTGTTWNILNILMIIANTGEQRIRMNLKTVWRFPRTNVPRSWSQLSYGSE